MEQLDQLALRLRQCSPEPGWSAQQWMIASTPFRMRLVGARKRLRELVRMSPVDTRPAIDWALDLRDARLTVEQKLRDVDVCLLTLHHVDASPQERALKAEAFISRRSDLLEALGQLLRLVSCRLPDPVRQLPNTQEKAGGHDADGILQSRGEC
jgi:hypothetical protein